LEKEYTERWQNLMSHTQTHNFIPNQHPCIFIKLICRMSKKSNLALDSEKQEAR